MGYLQKTVSVYGTEIEFLQAFISALTAADSRITCTTNDLAEQFANSGANPTFTFNFGGADTITFMRQNQSSSSTWTYSISSTAWSTSLCSLYFYSSSPSPAATEKVVRTWRFRVISATDLLVVDLMPYNSVTSVAQIACMTGTTKAVAYASASPFTAISNTFRLADTTTMQRVNRMPYTYSASNPSQIERITNKVFASGGTRVMTASNLMDVSTVTVGTVITMDGKNYYSLDANTLVEV